MKPATEPYIRLPQSITATEGRLGVLSLMAVTGWLLSNPKGYHAPKGGLKAQLKRYFRPGSRFEKEWAAFRCHLKLLRTPIGEDRFETFYELHWKIDRQTPALRFLTAEDGRAYAAKQGRYKEPAESYTQVPVALLKDNRLSPAAKGVVILALQELALQKNIPGYAAAKQAMVRKSGVKPSSFEAAWREAKASGYIRQERLLDEQTGRIVWGYSVAANPAEADENCRRLAERPMVRRKSRMPVIHHTETISKPAIHADERRAVRELVKENIGYEQLLQTTRTAPLYYHAEDIDGYVRLISDTICSTLPTVRINRQELPVQEVREALLQLRQEHILYVMERLADARIDHSPLAYKLTALYNAAVTYGDYAVGVA